MPGRRIGGAGGGSDPGKLGAGGVIVAVGLAAVLGVGATTAPGGSAASGGSASSSSSGRSASRSSDQDSQPAVARLSARGVRATVRLTDDGTDCAANSYGAVREFFEQHRSSSSVVGLPDRRHRDRGDRHQHDIALAVADLQDRAVQRRAVARSTLTRTLSQAVTRPSRKSGTAQLS